MGFILFIILSFGGAGLLIGLGYLVGITGIGIYRALRFICLALRLDRFVAWYRSQAEWKVAFAAILTAIVLSPLLML